MGRRACGALIVLVFATAGCGRSLSRSGAEATAAPAPRTTAPATTSAPVGSPGADASAVPPDHGTLSLRIFDDNALHPSGIPVEISGARDVTLPSDAEGVVSFTGPPGRYTARVVEGCHDELLVELGGTASFGLVGGRTTNGSLRAVWRHRFGPTADAPVTSSEPGDWRVGERVTVRFGVADRCTERLAPSVRLDPYVYDMSRNMKIREWAAASDDEGVARLIVSCMATGAISLVVEDETNPTDRLDLGKYVTGYGGSPRCIA